MSSDSAASDPESRTVRRLDRLERERPSKDRLERYPRLLRTAPKHPVEVGQPLSRTLLQPTNFQIDRYGSRRHGRQLGAQVLAVTLPLRNHFEHGLRWRRRPEQGLPELPEFDVETTNLGLHHRRMPIGNAGPLGEQTPNLGQRSEHDLFGEDVFLDPLDDGVVDRVDGSPQRATTHGVSSGPVPTATVLLDVVLAGAPARNLDRPTAVGATRQPREQEPRSPPLWGTPLRLESLRDLHAGLTGVPQVVADDAKRLIRGGYPRGLRHRCSDLRTAAVPLPLLAPHNVTAIEVPPQHRPDRGGSPRSGAATPRTRRCHTPCVQRFRDATHAFAVAKPLEHVSHDRGLVVPNLPHDVRSVTVRSKHLDVRVPIAGTTSDVPLSCLVLEVLACTLGRLDPLDFGRVAFHRLHELRRRVVEPGPLAGRVVPDLRTRIDDRHEREPGAVDVATESVIVTKDQDVPTLAGVCEQAR